jgi:uncharacterized Zn-finger protein
VTFATKLTNGNLNLKITRNIILQVRSINVTCVTSQLHIRHIQDYRFTCEICGKSFYTNPELQGHCTVHTGEKHECETCGKGFSLKGNLLAHLHIHDQNRKIDRYACDVCAKPFQYMARLHAHRKIHEDKSKLI